jgi:hypothetical protein
MIVALLLLTGTTIIQAEQDTTNNNCVGYQDRIELSSTVTLEYTVELDDPNDTTSEFPQGVLSGRLTYDGIGSWVAFGVSAERGRMIGGQAIVGEPDREGSPRVYDLDGKMPQLVTPAAQSSSQLLDDGTAVVQDDARTILTFTKVLVGPEDDRSIPIKGNGENSFLWAHGFNNFFPQIHQQKSAFTLILRPCNVVADGGDETDGFEEIDVPGPYKNLWSAHGWLAGIAFGVLTPLAISASLLRDFIPQIWLKFHMAFNVLTVCMTLAAFGIAVAALKKTMPKGEDTGHFSTSVPHRTVGLVLAIIVVLQALGGMLRPHKPKDDEKKSNVRTVWEIGHKLFGFGLLGATAWQVQEGIKLYRIRFPDAKDLKPAFWGVWGGILGVAFVGHVYSRFLRGNGTKSGQSSIEKVVVDEEISPSSSGTPKHEVSDEMPNELSA